MDSSFAQLEGAPALVEWFGVEPSFHDATLLSFDLRQGEPSTLKVRTFRMGPEVDAEGYYVQTKIVVVTFSIFEIREIELYEIMEAGIMDGLVVETSNVGTKLDWDASYGVHGHLVGKRVTVSFESVGD